MRLFVIASFMLLLGGCSNLDNRPERTQRPTVRVVKPAAPPYIPEIKAPVVKVKPHNYKRAAVIKHSPYVKPKRKVKVTKPRYKVTTKKKYKAPLVQRYPGTASAPAIQVTPKKIPPSKTVMTTKPEDAGLDIDPYANIPENADDKGSGRAPSSPAIKALLVQAYADAKLGRTNAAMIKLERGLRIEPQNPKLWNQLAELHYKKGNYQQAITMAKKAINLSSNDQEMTDKNWQFISKVAEKSGDSQAMSEVNAYNKRH